MFKNISVKKVIFTLILAGILTWLGLFAYKLTKGKEGKVLSSEAQKPEVTFSQLAKPLGGKPVQLVIAKLNMDLDIEVVGKDKDGFMETPVSWGNAGWYKGSTKTAEEGNLVINGHYDDKNGRPAAFWKLKTLAVNDKVRIVDEFDRPFEYSVKDVYYVAIDDPDRFKVFDADAGKQTLTLITCGGVWLPNDNTYNKRLIIKAERIN